MTSNDTWNKSKVTIVVDKGKKRYSLKWKYFKNEKLMVKQDHVMYGITQSVKLEEYS